MNMNLEKEIMEFTKEQNRKHMLRLIIGTVFSSIFIIGNVIWYFYARLKADEYFYYYTPEAMRRKISYLITDSKGFFVGLLVIFIFLIGNVWMFSKRKRDTEVEWGVLYMREQALFKYLDKYASAGIKYKYPQGVQHGGFLVLEDNPEMPLFVRRERYEVLYVWGEDETGEEIWHTVEMTGNFFHYFNPIYSE